MTVQRALLTLAISAGLLTLAGCKGSNPAGTAATPGTPAASTATIDPNENADQFVARVNKEMRADYVEATAAQWLSETYINDDSQLVASKANERNLAKVGAYAEAARGFEGKPMTPETERSLKLLRLGITIPPPKNPASLAELTKVGAKLNGDYGAGKYCPEANNPATCLDIGKIEEASRISAANLSTIVFSPRSRA